MWKWFKLTDETFIALMNANVPDTVLVKLMPLKNKDLSRRDMVKEITSVLNADEVEYYQDLILNHAVMLKGNARRLKRVNRLLIILLVLNPTIFLSVFISSKLLHVKIVTIILMIAWIIVAVSIIVTSGLRNDILARVTPWSEEDYSDEYSFFGGHPAKRLPPVLPSLRVRFVVWLGSSVFIVAMVMMRIFDFGPCCFIPWAFLMFFILPWIFRTPSHPSSSPSNPQQLQDEVNKSQVTSAGEE